MLRILHGKKLIERYKFLASEIGKEQIVFELACGSCLFYNYIDPSCEYIGWDLNQIFIDQAKKDGLNVNLQDIFNYDEYPDNDVVVIIDVLHHIVPRHEAFLKEVISKSKKVIVIEPFKSVNLLDILLLKKGPVRIFMKILNRFFGDNDGINHPDSFFEWKYTEEDLVSFFKKIKPVKITKSGKDLIAVF
ncbi:MAG: class I SAM-dependent methyltransferase [Spirochaetales bacterium]|nr:class I SAM-dependent methyltransferase [Spirochaetales bacterium]